MSRYEKTLVINLLGGPGSGKSSIRAGVFYELKFRGIDCEESTEVAKDLTWSKNYYDLKNQIYVFGKQHHRLWKLLGQVEVVITDSPLLLTPIYDSKNNNLLRQLAMEEFGKMWNYTVFLKRCKAYNPNGRNQTEDEAKEIDNKILDFLRENTLPFEIVSGNTDGKDHVVKRVLLMLGKHKTPTRKEMVEALEI